MILTVTLNLALDVTYRVQELAPETSVRVEDVASRAGGKGVNVARVLQRLGTPVVVAGLVGGPTGVAVRDDLAAAGLPEALTGIAGETRRTVAAVDRLGRVTILLEPGPEVAAEEWARFRTWFAEAVPAADVIVMSGSLPRRLEDAAYAQLVEVARSAGRPVILDASGAPFVRALAAGPSVVKPNRDELYEATGGPVPPPSAALDVVDVLVRAGRLRNAGAESVVVSLGRDGLVVLTGEGAWWARLPPGSVAPANPTGAGDAAVAALARGLVDGAPWPAILADAVALSAAATLDPLAGGFDRAAYARLARLVEVTQPEPSPQP